MLFRENKNKLQSRLPNSSFFSDRLQRVQLIRVCGSRENRNFNNVLSLKSKGFSWRQPLSSPPGSWKVKFLTRFAQSFPERRWGLFWNSEKSRLPITRWSLFFRVPLGNRLLDDKRHASELSKGYLSPIRTAHVLLPAKSQLDAERPACLRRDQWFISQASDNRAGISNAEIKTCKGKWWQDLNEPREYSDPLSPFGDGTSH